MSMDFPMMLEHAGLEAYVLSTSNLLVRNSRYIDISPQFDARPASFVCPSASKIQSYCDAADPYCCNGSDANTHQGYGAEYGSAALAFVKSKLSGSSTGTTTSSAPATTSTAPSTGACSALYGQCGGQGWTGATCCTSGTCKAANSYYSQCL